MPVFSISKIDEFRSLKSKDIPDVIDIKFPSELKEAAKNIKEMLIFVVDDDPNFMQILNTYFSKHNYTNGRAVFKFKVKNYATGESCLKELSQNPDLIFLNLCMNQDIKNTLNGHEILEQIGVESPGQKVAVLNALEEEVHGALLASGLREELIQERKSLYKLNDILEELLGADHVR